jgi:CRISPR-associated protein Csx10
MKRAWLVLAAQSDAVFTATAATLGGHEGLSHVPGSALWGWAAARLYGSGIDALTAFHSGKLRFGDGWPLTHTRRPAFSVPQCFRERKRAKGGVVASADGKGLSVGAVRNFQFDETFRDDAGKTVQPEAIKNHFVAADGSVHRPDRGWRGKTAIEPGKARAAIGQFFGYDHLRSGASFASLLEADSEPAAETAFDAVLKAFAQVGKSGETLRLGRSAMTEFGGHFSITIDSRPDVPWQSGDPLDQCRVEDGQRIVTFWCLSDLALEDQASGAPMTRPSPASLGLIGGTLDEKKSFITTRRYAPYNKALHQRDIDRAVIAAGSVIAIAFPADAKADELKRIAECGAGLYREAGLGRLWVNPPMLRSAIPRFGTSISFAPPARPAPVSLPDAWITLGTALFAWADEQRSGGGVREKAERCATEWKQGLDRMIAALRALNREPPTAAQWANVAEACRRFRSNEARLQQELAVICGKPAWREVAPGMVPGNLHDWIVACLGESLPQGVRRADALRDLANRAQKEAQEARR